MIYIRLTVPHFTIISKLAVPLDLHFHLIVEIKSFQNFFQWTVTLNNECSTVQLKNIAIVVVIAAENY